MRKFKQSGGSEVVDLDDYSTYKHLPNTIVQLNERILRNIGFTICYMDYWHLDVFSKEKQEPITDVEWTAEQIKNNWPDISANSGYYQRQRVYKLIEVFTKNRTDNWKNILWFKEQVFLFEDEIENMC